MTENNRRVIIELYEEKAKKRDESMKYKVILADDEEEALFGIQRNLDWEGYGFEVVGTFGNGRDVMEFLETQEADIVIDGGSASESV